MSAPVIVSDVEDSLEVTSGIDKSTLVPDSNKAHSVKTGSEPVLDCSERDPGMESSQPGSPGELFQRDRTDSLNGGLKQYEKKGRYNEIVRIVTQNVHRSLDLDEVIDSAVDVMNKHIESAQNVSIYMVEGNAAVLKFYRGYPVDTMKKLATIPYPRGFTWKTIMESKPTYCPDVDHDTIIGPLGRELGTKSYVSMPVCYSGKAIGCININSVKKYAFDEEELDLLELVAGTIEAAINNARRAEALQKSREALRENIAKLRRKNRFEKVISTVTRSVHQSLELDEVFDNAVAAINKEIKEARHVVIFMIEEKGSDKDSKRYAVMKANRGHDDLYLERVKRVPYPNGATWKTIIDGNPVYVPDVDKDENIGDAGREFGTKSYISMPLKLDGATVGCIHIHSSRKFAFKKDVVGLLEIVARQLETAIKNAKKTEALRKSEEALRKTRDELEERVRDRTSELQKSNTLLIKEILERRYVENELKQSLAEKDVLLEEIHHRVKNNLQIISSLLNLQSRKLKDEKALASFVESNNRIRSIATLHEQLYRSKGLSRIDFTTHIRNMTNHLLRSYGMGSDHIKVVLDSGQIYLDINTAIPLGLIVNELVSNAIKHGFAGKLKGEIRIEFRKIHTKYFLTVSNNGIKFPKDLDIDNSATLGLELVSSLSKQLKGAITISRGDVTEFKLEFSA